MRAGLFGSYFSVRRPRPDLFIRLVVHMRSEGHRGTPHTLTYSTKFEVNDVIVYKFVDIGIK